MDTNSKNDFPTEVKEWVTFAFQNMVNNPDDVEVSMRENFGTKEFVVKLHKDDFGMAVGRNGRNIESLRTVLRVMAKINICSFNVIMFDDEQRDHQPEHNRT